MRPACRPPLPLAALHLKQRANDAIIARGYRYSMRSWRLWCFRRGGEVTKRSRSLRGDLQAVGFSASESRSGPALLDSVLFDTGVKLGARQPEEPCGSRFVPSGLIHGLLDQAALH